MTPVGNRPKASDKARGHWRGILVAAGMDDKYLNDKGGPCPICGGTDRFVFDDKEGNGTFYCRKTCGAGGGFKLLGLYMGKDPNIKEDFRALALEVERYFGGLPMEQQVVKPYVRSAAATQSPEEIAKVKAYLKSIWDGGMEIQPGDPVWKYLHSRVPGLDDSMILKGVVRYHPALPYKQGDKEPEPGKYMGKFPAMIAKVMAPDGTVCNIHRTWLTADGRKAPVPSPKKMCSGIKNVKGFAIPLAKLNGPRMATAEGIETALAVMVFKGIPCWALYSTAGMKNFLAPEGITELDNFEDNDKPDERGYRPGFEAGKVLKERNEAIGVRVRRHAPQKLGTDMLEMLVSSFAKKVA